MSSHTASSSNGGNGSGDFGAPRRNSKRPKCDSLLYFSFFFFFLFWANSCLPSCDHGVSCVFKLQSFEPCPNFLA
jgi:hypothetical protein